jgi:hypothetical protein
MRDIVQAQARRDFCEPDSVIYTALTKIIELWEHVPRRGYGKDAQEVQQALLPGVRHYLENAYGCACTDCVQEVIVYEWFLGE